MMASETAMTLTIMDLPPSVIVNIYSFLNHEDILSMRKICPYWSHLSYDASIWKILDTTNCTKSFLSNGSFCNLLQEVECHVEVLYFDIQYISILEYLTQSDVSHCENLREMSITNERWLGRTIDINKIYDLNQLMIKLSQKGKKLRKLQLKDLFINTEAVFGGLKEFCFSSCKETLEKTFEEVEPSRLRSFLQRHPQIEHLDLDLPVMSCNRDLSVTSLLLDLPHLKNLRVLNTISEEVIPQLQPTNHQVILESLTLLCLSCLTDETLVAILMQVPDLKVFDVRYCEQISDITLKYLAKNCHKIKTFAIVGHQPVLFTQEGVKEVAYNCPKLECVSVVPTLADTDDDVYAYISHCPELRYLTASGGLTDRTLITMVDLCPNICYIDIPDSPKLTGAFIAAVLRGYKDLYYLGLDGCGNINTIDFGEVEDVKELKCPRQGIIEVNVDGEKSANDKHLNLKELEHEIDVLKELDSEVNNNQTGVDTKMPDKSAAINKRVFHIRALRMNECFNITDKSLYNMACCCTNLRRLYLSGCSDLTDNTVITFFRNCPFLHEFDISLDDTVESQVVEKVTTEGLAEIAKYGKNLAYFKLDFRNILTTEAVFEVISKCPIIKHVQLLILLGKTDWTKEKLMKFAAACSHKYICLYIDGEEKDDMTCMDIRIYDYKPLFSKKYMYCNFK